MLYRFKSRNIGDIIMLEANGRQMLEIIGKSPGPTGIILAEQIPGAVKALEAAIAQENDQAKKAALEASPATPGEGGKRGEGIGLHQRAKPFIDMLLASQRSNTEVVWGV